MELGYFTSYSDQFTAALPMNRGSIPGRGKILLYFVGSRANLGASQPFFF